MLDFVRERGVVHPREVDAHFAHGKVTNWFGGSSNATTQLLDGMHYRGLLRVARREGGMRLYAAHDAHEPAPADAAAALDALVDVDRRQVRAAAGSVAEHAGHVALAASRRRSGATARALRWRAPRQRLPHAAIDGHALVLAGRREPGVAPPRARRRRAPAGAVRPGGLGPPPLRAALGLGLPLRGLHAGAETRARLLRAAAAVARPGASAGATWRSATAGSMRNSATSPASRRATPRSSAPSTTNSIAFRPFSKVCRLRLSRLASASRRLGTRPVTFAARTGWA